MSKNDLYNSMRSKAPLSKEAIGDHLSRRSRLDEAELDSFEKDALDGWASTGTAASTSNLDKRFISKSRSGNLILVLSSIASVAILIVIFTQMGKSKDSTSAATAKTQNNNLVEETDLFIAEKFDTLVEEKIANRVEVKSLQVQQEVTADLDQVEVIVEPVEIEKLPLLKIKPEIEQTEIKISRKRKIKEINLSNFNLVDYRTIRSKPAIETKQLDLSGTAANQENKGEADDEPVWKKVNIPYIDYIEKSMYHLDKGHLKKALARFDVILSSYPEDINALFYSGFTYYSLGDYTNASSCFSKTLYSDISNFDEDALWYLGLSYEKSGETNKAKEIYTSISNSKSHYAKAAVEKINSFK